MDFELNEEQTMLKRTAKDFLTRECSSLFVREMVEDSHGYTPELWGKISQLGWTGLVIPENYGGSNGSFFDLTVLLEEMGAALLPGPLATNIVGTLALLKTANKRLKQELLPKIAKGEIIISLALTEPSAKYTAEAISTTAIAKGSEYTISGTKLFISDAHIADYLICAARIGDK